MAAPPAGCRSQGPVEPGDRQPSTHRTISQQSASGGRMPHALEEARYELTVANRIVAHEGVLDAFGHISMRHPLHPDRYLLSCSRAPEFVEPADVLEFTL